jgi:Protein of unknown function (DUF4089)
MARLHRIAELTERTVSDPEPIDAKAFDAKAFDTTAFASLMAAALDLPLTPEYAPAVEANLAVAFRLAPLFLDFPLPDDAEPAPVFSAMGDRA